MVDPESAYCWHCGAWLPDSQRGNGDGGWGDDGGGDGFGNGKGNGFGRRLPLCTDSLACAVRQTTRPA